MKKNKREDKGKERNMFWIFVIAVVLAIPACYLLTIVPNLKKKKQMKEFRDRFFAHRGIFDNEKGTPENTMKAFRQAVACRYGIELDVQLSRDKKMVVFHDPDLKRAAGLDQKVSELTWEELKEIPLFGSREHIPLFEDVLDMVDGQVPLIVEIKTRWNYREICPMVSGILSAYRGPYCIESFQPLAVRWFRKNNPSVIRGQLSGNFFRDHLKDNALVQFLLENLMFNFVARPDFIAYNCRDKKNLSFTLCKCFYRVTTAAWTIRSEKQLEENRKDFDMIIFDGFLPADTWKRKRAGEG